MGTLADMVVIALLLSFFFFFLGPLSFFLFFLLSSCLGVFGKEADYFFFFEDI